MDPLQGTWQNTTDLGHRSYICGYCGERTGVRAGYFENNKTCMIFICGGCNRPTYFENYESQTPAPTHGNKVLHLPDMVEILYDQARRCMQVESYTACVLVCRKILMHIAVEKGAQPNQQFIQYVDYLAKQGYVPPDGKGWVDHIRRKGNEATHEIVLMPKTDAAELLSFVEMLLRFVFEFPGRMITSTS